MPRVLRCNMRGTCAQTAIVVAVLLAQCQQTGCSNDARRRAPAVPVSVQDRIKRKTRQWQPGTREGGVGVGGEGADEQPVAQRPATDQDGDGSWRNKAAERLGLARGAGQERSSETKAGTAEAANNALQCNVTLACHACPEASIRDRAEYCLPTRWRQQVRCLRLGVEVEVRFESCEGTGGTVVSEHTAVLQMEAFWALVFVASWMWLQQRRRRRAPGCARAGSSADKKGSYVAMGPVPTTP